MQVSVELENADGSLQLKTTATQVLFAGFLRAFEGFDIGVEGGLQACSAALHGCFGLC